MTSETLKRAAAAAQAFLADGQHIVLIAVQQNSDPNAATPIQFVSDLTSEEMMLTLHAVLGSLKDL